MSAELANVNSMNKYPLKKILENSSKRISVLLADDHAIVREGIRALLKNEVDIEVVGEAENGRQAMEMAIKLCPDIILMDFAMPLLNGLEATRQMQKLLPKTKILVLSAHSDDAYVEHMMNIGAHGYLIKQTSFQILATAIREVYNGKKFFSPSIAKQFLDLNWKSKLGDEINNKKSKALSTREAEVLQLIAEGQANKLIASTLTISIKTVEKHRQNLMGKLNIHDTAGLTRYAISEGIIENRIQGTGE